MRIPVRRPFALPRIPRRNPVHLRWTLPALILCASSALAAAVTTHPPAHHLKPRHAHHATEIKPAAPIPPPAPPPPSWPVDLQPKPASVTWDSRGLAVDASNSSLAEILHQISTATGVRVEGFSSDQRVFGDYGPGPARDVLSELLAGSGYNVLILGGRGSNPPTSIVLSPRPTGAAPPAPPARQESEYDNSYPADSEPPQPIEPNVPAFQPGTPVRTPQQIMEEMERQRQMQIQNQQQQQQQQSNPDSPNN